MKLTGRQCLILGATTLGLVAVGGCWVDSSQTTPPFNGSSAGASNSAGAPAGGAPAGGAPAGGAPAGGAPAGGADTGGAPAGGAPAGGAPAGGAPAGGAPAGGAGGDAAAGAGGAGACPAPSGTHQTTAIARTCWVASASDCASNANNNNPPVNALDGVATTRFSTGMTMPDKATAGGNFTYTVDMGAAVMISGIKVDSSVATDAAASLQVDVSTDSTTWKPAVCGTGATVTDLSFAAVSARYIRLTESGTNTGWWSIHEFNVYGATGTEAPCNGGTGPTGAMCTTTH